MNQDKNTPNHAEWKLMHCPNCDQMTNNYKGLCQKCNKFITTMPKFIKEFFERKNDK